MKKLSQFLAFVFLSAILLLANLANAQQFKVVGYIPNWGAGPGLISTMDYSKVTHINYSFLNPTDGSGTLDTWTPGLAELVTKAHAANVKVLVAIGGAGTSASSGINVNLHNNFLSCINSGNRGNFINNLSNFVTNNNLDGIDVDIEGDGINGDYSPFVNQLCDALHAKGKLVTAAIKSDYGNPDLVTGSFAKLDFANVMCYDHTGNWDASPGQHSPYQYSIDMVNFFNSKGMPYSKMTFGVPFYGYGWNSDAGTWTYAAVIAKYPGATNVDQAGNIIYYNGIQTIKDKTAWACSKGMGGMMIWELTNDVANYNTSLMKAIHDAMGSCASAPPTVSITSPANNASFVAGSNITINANASSTSGSISKVEFFNGSTSLGSDNSSPYSFTWNNVAGGVYTINAVATSNTGSTATASITIHVTGPKGGTPWPIPGKVEAENYDEGGQGFAYNDVTSGNSGAAYRNEDVDIEPLGSGYDVGYTAAGEWMKYTVNVASTGLYNFQFPIATTATGKSFHIEMDGVNVTGAVNLPNTGAWGTYQTVTVNNVSLNQGKHEMKIYMDTDGFNIDYINVVAIPAPTITFNNITKNYGDGSFTVGVTTNSPGAVTYSITSGSQYATIAGNQVTIKGAGIVTIQANQAAGGGYNTGTATATLTINKANLTITADNKSKTYNTANPALTASYGGFVYGETSSVLTTQPAISTTAVTNSNVGTYPINVSGAAAANYNISYVNGTLTVNQATPTLSYTSATSGNQGASIPLTASSNSTGAITYSVANVSGAATLSGNTLNLTQVGTVTLTVNLAASQNYTAASIQQTITINSLGNPTITFANITKTYGDAPFTLSVNTNSPGAVTYSITAGSAFATISGNQVTIKGAGTVTIQASQAAGGGYNAGTASSTLTINKAVLTVTAENKSKIYNTPNPTLTMVYSGFVLGETSAVLTSQPSISTGASGSSSVGTYPITLSGGTAANYTINLVNGVLTIDKAAVTINYTGLTSGIQGGTISLSATSNSGGAISYSVSNGSGIATIVGLTLNLTQAGTVNLTINVAASGNYLAGSITQVITINSTTSPSISFLNVTKNYGDPSFTVTANSNSSGAISYSITAGSQFATISGNQVTIKGAGSVTIQASQAADGGFSAGSATSTLTINKATLTVTADNKAKAYNTANPALTMTYSGFVYGETSSVLSTLPTISTSAVSNSNVGTYPITVTGAAAANYNINYVGGILTVNQATPTLTYTGVTSGNQGSTINLTANSNSTGAITFSVANGTGAATLSGTNLSLTQTGTVIVTINVEGTSNYAAASIQQTIAINSLGSPNIIFNNVTKTYGDAPFTVGVTTTSSGALSYSILSGSQFASITPNGQVTIKRAGIVSLQVDQAPGGGFSAGSATAVLTINKANLTITAENKSKTFNTDNPTLTYTYTGFVYNETSSVLNNQPLISTTALLNSNVGTYPISLSSADAANYTITYINGTLNVTKATPSLNYTGNTSGIQGGSISLSSSTNSDGAITYNVSNGTGTASISGNTLNLTQTGTVSLTVQVAATQNYNAASIQQPITINALGSPTIIFNNVTKTYGDAPFVMNATSNSPGAIAYSITSGSQFATITSGGTVTILGAGVVTIQASQVASGSFSAGSAIATLTINKSTTSGLTYTGPSSGKVGETLTLSASSSTSGAITYQLLSGGTGAATLRDNQLTLESAGTVTIQITIAGDANHEQQIITQQITILPATGIINAVMANASMNVFPNPFAEYANVQLEIPERCNGRLELCDMNGRVLSVLAEGMIETQAQYYLPMSEYSGGLYILKLSTEKGTLVKKITK